MPDEKNTGPLTEEQETEMAEGRAIAYQWMRRHTHDYSAAPKNAGILSAWIKKHRQGEWSVENLEAAFDATKNHLETIAVKTSPPPQATKESLPEWGILTRKRIAEMDRTEYKWLLKNPQFKAEVTAVLQGETN